MPETYTFAKPVEITTKGSLHLVEEIEMSAPTGRIQNMFSRLEAEHSKLQKICAEDGQAQLSALSPESMKIAMDAMHEREAAKDGAKKDELSIEDHRDAFLKQAKSSGFDLSTSYMILKEILTEKKADAQMITDGKPPFKMESGHWDKLPMREIKGLLAFYIANFISGSD